MVTLFEVVLKVKSVRLTSDSAIYSHHKHHYHTASSIPLCPLQVTKRPCHRISFASASCAKLALRTAPEVDRTTLRH